MRRDGVVEIERWLTLWSGVYVPGEQVYLARARSDRVADMLVLGAGLGAGTPYSFAWAVDESPARA